MNESQVLAKIKKFVDAHGTQKEAAAALAISPQYLSDILSGRRPPTDSVLSAIQVERVAGYRSARKAPARNTSKTAA